MNPAHRDRLAFMRIVLAACFEKGMTVWHSGSGKEIQARRSPSSSWPHERESVETAYPGDIIGLFDPGIYRLGDTLCAGPQDALLQSIPVFAPEHSSPACSPAGQHEAQAVSQGHHAASARKARSRPSCAPNTGREEMIWSAWWACCSLTCWTTVSRASTA